MPLLNQLFKYLSLVCVVLFMAQAQANYLVSDAGEADANGIYLEYATQDGVPAYRKEGGAQTWFLYRCGGMWLIEPFDFCLRMNYYVFNDPDTPPATGWNGGPGPAPTVGPAGPLIGFSSKTLFESLSNDGRFQDTLTLTHNLLDGDGFTGLVGENLLATGKAALSNLPAGLSATLHFVSSSELELVLSGAALDSSQADNVSNLTLQFSNSAFLSGDASANTNAEIADLRLQFRDLHRVGTSDLYASIAAAVAAASPYDILQLAAETFTEKNINLTKALVIVGAGAEQTIIQAMATPQSEQGRIFSIGSGVAETIIDGVTLRNGYLTGQCCGGAIFAQSPLQINNSRLTNNRVESNSMFAGGAIFMGSTLTMKNTLVDGNSGHLASSARVFGGALVLNSSATAILINTTFTANSITAGVSGTDTLGGAIALYVTSSLTLINSTVTGNSSAGNGGGIGQFGAGGSVSLVNSIVSGNNAALSPATADLHIDTLTDLTISHSIIGFRTESNDESIDNLITGDPMLAALADNGGASHTFALLPGSPAISAGSSDADVPNKDQRSYWRLGAVDMGAYQANGFILTFNGNGADSGSPPLYQGAAMYPAENTLTKADHSFSGWNTVADGSGVAYAAGAAITPQAGTFTLYAQWQSALMQYVVTTQSENGTLVCTPNPADAGSAVSCQAQANEGFTFIGFSGDCSDYQCQFAAIDANKTVTAHYNVNNYTLSFDSAGGSAVTSASYGFGATVTTPAAPTREGYTFAGWTPALPASMPANNISVTAQWNVNTYSVSFDSAGGSAVASASYGFGAAVTTPAAPTREGYTFAGWTPALPATMPANDVTLVAQWDLNIYRVRFIDWDDSVLQQLMVEHGQSAVIPVLPERTGYHFTGWDQNLSPITQDIDVRALYEELAFTVSVNLTGAAQVTPASQTVLYGRTAAFAVLLENETDVVVVSGSCAASYAAGSINTAEVFADCELQVLIYDPVVIEADNLDAGPINQLRRFSVLSGSGDQRLLEADLMRSGRVAVLTEDETLSVLTQLADGSYQFVANKTGRYIFRFVDENSGELVEISFDIMPYLAFTSSRQQVEPEITSTVALWLSDEPIEYPVTADFAVSNAELSTLQLRIDSEHQLQRSYSVQSLAEGASIVIKAETVLNALVGSPNNHQLVLVDQPLALAISAKVTQQDTDTLVISRRNGRVDLAATELNNVAATYSWTAADLTLNVSAANAWFEPLNIDTGTYQILVHATDGRRDGQYQLQLRIIDDCPYQSCYSVSGIPAEVNPFSHTKNRLPVCPAALEEVTRVDNCQGQGLMYIEVPSLYTLALGLYAGDVSWSSKQFSVALNDGSLNDTGFAQIGFMVNLDILDLQVPGESVPVMLPLPIGTTIPANAVWRKFTNMQWHDFVEDANNQVQSAARAAMGQCPVVSSDVWEEGIIAGYDCIRLVIEDGGPNDDDSRANGVIRDPGVLAVRNSYTLTFDSNSGSAIAPVTQLYGSELDIAAPLRQGYSFIGWSPALPATMPEQDLTLVAQWQINQYQIRFDTAGGQALAPITLNFGSGINVPTPVRQGYTFTGWNPILPQSMPAQDLQVTAQWDKSSVVVKSSGGSMQMFWLCGLLILTVRRYVKTTQLNHENCGW
ncbi:hypothetical protein WG68_00315 [Arsukibacterium ikkense]|uniref:Bacterial repeat domain-containing protein n=1 Tax=Arsukibacterium ikkense TaxID=336831 RepID=A0A0M2V8I1_9GAMM|nr:InlB B-repeat-containing protein [Arsukibacterium ikkense]KKO47137.1 hypothetical protein WG68_00315 [Arsukibacterium ikkense]